MTPSVQEQSNPKEGKGKAKRLTNKFKKPRLEGDNKVEEDSDAELCEALLYSKFMKLTNYTQSE